MGSDGSPKNNNLVFQAAAEILLGNLSNTERRRSTKRGAKVEEARKHLAQAEQHRDNTQKGLAEVRLEHHKTQPAHFERFPVGCPLDADSANLLPAGVAASGLDLTPTCKWEKKCLPKLSLSPPPPPPPPPSQMPTRGCAIC